LVGCSTECRPTLRLCRSKVDVVKSMRSNCLVYSFPKFSEPIKTSLMDTGGIGGSNSNIKHSLTGASAVNEEVGAAGSLKHVIIPNH
jgi:hypothetical protein